MKPLLSKYHPTWHHTMLRVKSATESVGFYKTHFGMQEICRLKFDESKFSLHFLAILKPDMKAPEDPESKEARKFLWNYPANVIELTYNYGTEQDANLKYNNGNVEPHRGFGHIAFHTNDVYAASEKLEKNGVKFQKRPNEGRMMGLAFALDPDGYWIEIIKRNDDNKLPTEYNLSQTMMRIKDPEKSLPFYRDTIGMTLVREKHFPEAKFSLYFFATLEEGEVAPDPKSEEAGNFLNGRWRPVLELTHNHGTESDPNFKYHSGNEEPKGFGHIAYLVDDIDGACQDLEKAGVQFKKKPNDGSMKGIAFAYDPDGYWIEFVPKGWE